jgi:transcriptional regulator with PAS, ATPase and Fis domain
LWRERRRSRSDLPREIAFGQSEVRATTTLNLKEHEERLIRLALEKLTGNRKRAAEALHVSPVTLWRKMKEYGLAGE